MEWAHPFSTGGDEGRDPEDVMSLLEKLISTLHSSKLWISPHPYLPSALSMISPNASNETS